jgi:hypothetical protein
MLLDHIHKGNAKTLGRMTRIHSETMTDDVTRDLLKASNPAATERGSIIDEWNNSGHVKSRLWEFHQSDKQSGCVYYFMEGWKPLL